MEQPKRPEPLPRDTSRFRRLTPDPVAEIRPDPTPALKAWSTAELVGGGKLAHHDGIQG